MKNIEIKTPLADRGRVELLLKRLGAGAIWQRRQVDTFFQVERGWLKLREVAGEQPELVSYRRSTGDPGPRVSDYDVVSIPSQEAPDWKRLLDRVSPVLGIVEKDRTLWTWKHTRVHLDQVRDLGDFLELETVVRGISPEEAHAEADQMIKALELDCSAFLAVPYLQLLLEQLPTP